MDRRHLELASGPPLGFALWALVDAVAIAVAVSLPHEGLGVRALHQLFGFAQTLSMGLLLGAVVLAGAVVARGRWPMVVAYALAAILVMHAVLGPDLERQAEIVAEGRWTRVLLPLYVALCGAAIPAAHVVGAVFGARWPRLALLVALAGLGGMITNQLVLRDDYPAVHAAIGWTSATLAGAALARRALRGCQALGRRARVALVVGATAALLVALYPPPNGVRRELFRQPGATAAWLLAATLWSTPSIEAVAPADPWLGDRSGLPDLPPSDAPRAAAPVMVLVTIDAVRADVIDDAANAARWPTLTAMRNSGAYFPRAVSPGSQTSVSLSAVFSGRYYSMQRWAPFGSGAARFLYAAEDPAPRFPELLRDAGVTTVSFPSLQFLAQAFGVVRGFQEETTIAVGRRHAPGREVIDPLLARLERVGAEPFFAFVHLTEPHSPYDRGGTEGSTRDRYLAEIGVADAQVARVARVLEQRFRGRGYLVVTADHGEAFGEHGTTHHTKTLYDELLRVPLLVRGPGVRPRRIERPVGLVDLGPTVLDIFRRPIPASYLGQSLLPLLAGGDGAELTRPLVAEGRMRRAWLRGDRKVIEDLRRTTVEAYDLGRDPGELADVFDRERARFEPDLAMLRAFFGAHAVAARDPSYSAPYKP
jgi:hypothetical protein